MEESSYGICAAGLFGSLIVHRSEDQFLLFTSTSNVRSRRSKTILNFRDAKGALTRHSNVQQRTRTLYVWNFSDGHTRANIIGSWGHDAVLCCVWVCVCVCVCVCIEDKKNNYYYFCLFTFRTDKKGNDGQFTSVTPPVITSGLSTARSMLFLKHEEHTFGDQLSGMFLAIILLRRPHLGGQRQSFLR